MVTALAGWLSAAAYAQFAFEAFELEHPAIQYRFTPPADAVAALNLEIAAGRRELAFEGPSGYLRALLAALDVPVESQMVVYSTTSLQGQRIRPGNPRAIYFNDSVAVAWVRGGFIEVASQDPRQGGIFYLLPQNQVPTPQLLRDDRCLTCHYALVAQGVPGFFVRSVPTATDGVPMPWLGNAIPDHRTPLEERWAGWYVTGNAGSMAHLGNMLLTDRRAQELPARAKGVVTTLDGRFPTGDYLSPHSDIVALLVFNHQARMMNLVTRIGWESRALAHDGKTADASLRDLAAEVVDYMLFVGEAPLHDVRGSSSFAATFQARGPRDAAGRSLRDLDLERRLMRYPCSYMIYAPAFDALPADAKDAIYRRLWQVLSGEDRSATYATLTQADRRAIVEILRDTKKDLPSYFIPLQSRPRAPAA